MVKILSEKIQSLEAVNEDLLGSLELLERQGTPERVSVENPSGNMNEERSSAEDEMSSAHAIAKEGCNDTCKASRKVENRGTKDLRRTQQKARRSTLYIRKIPVLHRIEDIKD